MLALTVSAQAADLPNRSAPAPYAAAPLFTWTGAYVGINGGALWANRSTPILWDAEGVPFPGPISGSNTTGVSVGGTAGYNFQLGPNVVAGVEGDLSRANINRKSRLLGVDDDNGDLTVTTGKFANKLEYFGTLRGRVGFLAMPSLLVYATGGLAYADVTHTTSGSSTDIDGTEVSFGSKSSKKWSYPVGAGVEYAHTNNWSVKGEYLYVGLSDTKYPMHDLADGEAMALVKEHNAFSTVRLGLNYRFGGF
ncbi:outer membrane protein [Microvirga sp. GCM10011540]|uniref:outer membrane protein n=1 Tax=Microvirga sp. GCM10011540 TaxID=3317338 RepID=UPI003616093F